MFWMTVGVHSSMLARQCPPVLANARRCCAVDARQCPSMLADNCSSMPVDARRCSSMPGWAHLSIIAVVLHTFVDSNVAARAVFPHVEAGALARRKPLKVDRSFAAAMLIDGRRVP